MWLCDRGNCRGRLAKQLLDAAAGDDPQANRAAALALADLAVADYDRVLAVEPRTFDTTSGRLYVEWLAAQAAAFKADSPALARHFRDLSNDVSARAVLHRAHPTDERLGREMAQALGELDLPIPLADKWLDLVADPTALDALLALAEALAPPASVTWPNAKTRLDAARAKVADWLRQVDEKRPLPERGKKLLDSLDGKT